MLASLRNSYLNQYLYSRYDLLSMPILYLTIFRKLTENCKKSVSSCAHRFARDLRRLADFWTITIRWGLLIHLNNEIISFEYR